MVSAATGSSQPARGQESARSGLIVTVLGLLAAIQIADPFISSVALVRASDGLEFTAAQQSLAAGISTFALAATVVFGGVLADRVGRKRVLVASILVSSAGQLITALSPEPTRIHSWKSFSENTWSIWDAAARS